MWIPVRRPTTTGRILFDDNQHAYRFGYHKDLPIQDEIWTPAVSFFWGRGLEEADKLLANQFDLYEEMPDWGWKTVWFWLHPPWTKNVDYFKSAEAVKILSGECGVNGYGIFAHDLPLSGNDCDMHSPAPSPFLGGDSGMKLLAQTIQAQQAHSYAWISRHDFRPDSLDFNPQWGVKGIDDRNIRLRNTPDAGVNLDMINPMNDIGMSFKDYKTIANDSVNQWVCRTVRERGVKHATGLGDGISRLDEFVMVSPEAGGSVLIPDAPSETLGHILSGTSVTGKREEGGIRFTLTETGPYSF